MSDKIQTGQVRGQISVWDSNFSFQLHTQPNQTQYGWGAIAAQCAGKGLRNYKISTMYIEFENVDSPEDAVTPPTLGVEEGAEYFQSLSLSSVRDYLRVPVLTTPDLAVAAGFEDVFPEGEGNKLTFMAQTAGTTGVHGRTFSDSVNSKVFGMALVSTPVSGDSSRDLVFARTYLESANQVLKVASGQIGLTWNIIFG